jgi:citrate lyase gamma subunit
MRVEHAAENFAVAVCLGAVVKQQFGHGIKAVVGNGAA